MIFKTSKKEKESDSTNEIHFTNGKTFKPDKKFSSSFIKSLVKGK